ncbi:hypothetical protein AB0I69_16595 [Streptomyces sp. NPDC050508]|uniref:hypothetical protein n=1 Tax=Streptomyces sp. NPDC050508 TaxID=3155405 RepID=UPI0034294BF4
MSIPIAKWTKRLRPKLLAAWLIASVAAPTGLVAAGVLSTDQGSFALAASGALSLAVRQGGAARDRRPRSSAEHVEGAEEPTDEPHRR